ncbi:hypothetical protein AKJ37_00880 [candidate division MSBL1 archaeon SCGC-AAA259I09]|uniref:Uncharacterized protein n=1 Tax=candidate division MSBL1 archaeon SCGC-AAA259I09 TaxID=1698267 RepID=A0A133UVF0_9EURY|nr:hypothetical protein AKJ37_00880 [candidate division MSBL1 archaeon SCGC-AAA259I09]
MSGDSTGNKNVRDEGRWHPIAEKFSRRERIKLLDLLLEDIYQSSIAEACGVCSQAVSNWVCKENYCPSNESAVYLLKLGHKLNPEGTAEIIRKGIERYLDELEEIGIEVRKDLKD